MQYRKFGKSGLEVSEIGYGGWGIGGAMWQGATDAESIKALNQAVDLGVTFIDTALAYGKGHSEKLVGKIVRECKKQIYVATKIPPKNGEWPARPGVKLKEAFPFEYIIRKTDLSLSNLGRDTIDVQQFHVWNDEWTEEPEWQDAISTLKEQGKIRLFGVSINDHEPENALRLGATGLVDSFQVIYNIFDQTPEAKLFPFCIEKNIAVIVRVPFDEGALTGAITPSTTFPKGDWRNDYFKGDRKKQVAERIAKLSGSLGQEAHTLAELALRFTLSHPAVSTVIPGMRTVKNVDANCRVSDGRVLSKEMLQNLKEHRWDRNFYH
jgi:aryl-alcohol dehydrogenase-like predicted oxidoreductase